MAGDVALARVERGRVRAVVAWSRPWAGHGVPAVAPTARGAGAVAAPRILPRFRARWRDLREQWAMTTCSLFDPDSWR